MVVTGSRVTASIVFLIFGLTQFFIFSCAHMEPPPGGPADSLAPWVAAQYPAPFAVNQPRELTAILEFSEWMKEEESPTAILVNPALPRKIHMDWSGKKVHFTYRDLLDTNTTYNITVTPKFNDISGNAFKKEHQLVFSTGTSIDSSQLLAKASSTPKAGKSALVALYPLGQRRFHVPHLQRPDDTIIDSLPHPKNERPMYLFTFDTSGTAQLKYLKKGQYAMLAFIDENSDLRPQIGSEAMAIGPGLVFTGEQAPIFLYMDTFDTLPPAPAKLVYEATEWVDTSHTSFKGWLNIEWQKPIDSTKIQPDQFIILSTDSAETTLVAAVNHNGQTGKTELLPYQLKPDHEYLLRIQKLWSASGDTIKAPLSFRFRTPDSLYRFATDWKIVSPLARDSGLILREGVLMYRNKPISLMELDSLRKNFRYIMGKDTLNPTPILRSSHTLLLKVPGLVHNGKKLSLEMKQVVASETVKKTDSTVIDSLKKDADTTKPVEYAFKSIWSSGLANTNEWAKIEWNQKNNAGSWIVKAETKGFSAVQKPLPTTSRSSWDSLPSGNYMISYILDRNRNGKWDKGSLFPWTEQEPRMELRDTLKLENGDVRKIELEWPPVFMRNQKE